MKQSKPTPEFHGAATAVWAVIAAFGAYFCMYGFRKPFTVAEYQGLHAWNWEFKVAAVSAQTLGYMLSKFIGIKVISELDPRRRAAMILKLIVVAELALVGFGMAPAPWNVALLFLNGLPLGMVFGLVLGFLEGRRLTEAMAAGLCASFILADGVVKSVGKWLLGLGVTEFWMPAAAGLVFLLPLAGFVWMLMHVPAPSQEDVALRSARGTMRVEQRQQLLSRYWRGLAPLLLMYLVITIIRSIRADFAPEIWSDLGVTTAPSLFARSEFLVAVGVLLVNGSSVLIRDNRLAFLTSLWTGLAGMVLVAAALLARPWGLPPFVFMVSIGLGLYLPYVAMHTTVFERMMAMTREHGNIAFLMYVADSIGYLGYVALIMTKQYWKLESGHLSLFVTTSWIAVGLTAASLLAAWLYFARLPVATTSAAAPAEAAGEAT
ncbi:MAG: hypothetical protein KDB14_29865 [Planctomycetales bacterium]|nr:hypothetical protein [Planctomycetales bacterium]